jgi:beta-lactamase regulating signal transducer with metallopeptidase domain/HEAT repeat protein
MNVTEALGWALLHSLWQCTLAAAALSSLLAIVSPRAARTRYALAVTTLILMLAVPMGTAVRLRAAGSPAGSVVAAAAPAIVSLAPAGTRPAPAPSGQTGRSLASRVRADVEPALPWIVVAWLSGVVTLSIRLASGWLVTRRLSTVGTRPVPRPCQDALARLVVRLRVTRPVRVLESAVVQVPAVIGWLRPVVLLPASALTGLTPLQLDALLAHELAHVRRYDYLVNLLQSAIETLLFYHPAVWWVSRRVRDEREHCCDDVAVAACGDAHFYATALLGMERLRNPVPALSMAAAGGSLVERVRRLMAPAPAEIFPRGLAGALAVMLALALAAGGSLAAGSVRSAPGAARDPTAPAGGTAPRATRDQVRTLRRRGDQLAVARLLTIAHDDPDEDMQQDAVDALGKLRSGDALAALIDIARTHPNEDVRREAVEKVGRTAPHDVALEVLPEIVRTDRDHHVQHEAVDELGELHDRRAFPVLLDVARHHPSLDVRRKAVAALGEMGQPDSAADVLEQMALRDSSEVLQQEAVEALGHLNDPRALERMAQLARTHPDPDVRDEATEQYATHAAPDAALALLTDRAAHDTEPEVQAEAVELLAALPRGAGIPAVIAAAGDHASPAARAEAWRRLRASDDPRARAFVRGRPRP